MQTSTSFLRSILLCALAATLVAGCSDTPTSTTPPPTDQSVDEGKVLSDVNLDVIVATYADLKARANTLADVVATLDADPTAANFAQAQQAWRDARRPWEQSEAFLFGPVETQGIDPGIDSWPVNKADLDAVLAGDATLSKEYIDGLEGTLKGFHTIEYLLFGQNASKTVEMLTKREREYLVGVTQSFYGAVSQLYQAWDPAGQDFGKNLRYAGTDSSAYSTRKSALQELLTGMIAICDEVGTGKIGDPYTQQDRSLEESQFSNNSNADFQDNIRSVKNVYLGTLDGTAGDGICKVVAAKDTALDARVRAEIDAAITAIGQMTPTFGEAISSNRAKVEAAQNAVLTVRTTLEQDVQPLILN
jgi:uncharacterized iron-regulated protein